MFTSLKSFLTARVTMAFLFTMPCSLLAQNSAQTIINDMTLPCDAKAHGTEGLDWGDNCGGATTSVPHQNYKGEWMQAMTNWGQVYIPREGSSATNTRCQLRNIITKFLLKDGKWYTMQGGVPGGAAFVENFANNSAMDAGARDESNNGGGVSVIVGVGPWAGHNYHFWSSGSRAYVDINTIVGVYTSCEMRLIKSNPNGPDDRAQCKNIAMMGADWWLSQSGGWLPDWSANGGIGGGRFKYVTNEWQSFNFCTRSPSEITANPPIDSPLPSTLVTGVSVSPTSTSILAGATVQLTQAVAPAYAANKTVSWSSSNNSIASVDANGLVKGIGAGSATITVTTVDGNKIATCAVMVTANNSVCSNPTIYDMSFESGNTSAWTASWGNVSAITGNSHSGTYAGQTSGYGSLNQDINLSPNTSYTLTAWLKTSPGTAITLGVKNFGGTEVNTSTTSTNWTQISINFKTGSTNKSAQIYAWQNGGNGNSWADDFSITCLGSAPIVTPTCTPPSITTQPSNITVNSGATATFTVLAAGSALSYQWKKNGVNLNGETGASYTTGILTKGNSNEKYTCTITNSCGPNITSNAATLTVVPVLVTAGCVNPTLSNPGFENGNANGWGISWGNYSVVSGAAHTGNYSAQVGGIGAVEQIVNLSPNTAYTLSGWLKAASGSSIALGVKNFGGTEISASINSTTWSQSSVLFTTGSSNTSAQIYAYQYDQLGNTWADDVSISCQTK